jgi:hypothetical protein
MLYSDKQMCSMRAKGLRKDTKFIIDNYDDKDYGC